MSRARARTSFVVVLSVAAAGAIAAACFDAKTFDCGGDDARCASGEVCISNHCAEPNASCPSGFSYTRSFPAQSHACVTVPDGGVRCSRAGNPCDDHDPCTENDVCIDTATCMGTPKVCPQSSCSGNMLTASVCMGGSCMTTVSTCPTGFLCGSSTNCANTCTSADQCVAGSYCVSGKCLSCNDFLSNNAFVPAYGAATVIPGIGVNTVPTVMDGGTSGGLERSPTLSGDRMTLYFASDRAGGNGGVDLYRATRAASDLTTPFASPERLVPLNAVQDEIDLSTGDDGFFVFASNRGTSFDIYQTSLSAGVFQAPGLIAGDVMAPINSASFEGHPWASSDGKRLYFETDRDTPMAMVERQSRIYLASRTSPQVAFGPVVALSGLESINPTWSPQWTSPVLTRDGGALFLLNQAVPTRPEVAVVHLDKTTGLPVSVPTTLHGLNVGGGGQISLSSDGCTLLMQRKENGEADLWWSQRSNVAFCNTNVPCGAPDGCCPAQCSGVIDQDCPFPRTLLVSEYLSNTGTQSHDYLVAGETPKAGYAATGVTMRLFIDALPTTVALNRFVSTTICGSINRSIRIGIETSAPSGYTLDKQLGYVFPLTSSNTNGVNRVFRNEFVGNCDRPMTFDPMCGGMGVGMCIPVGFAVKP